MRKPKVKVSKTAATVQLVREPLTTFTLTYEEPMHKWLIYGQQVEADALKILTDRGIKVIEEFGGAGVGDWANGSHETGFVIETDESTAMKVAVLMEGVVGYHVAVTKDEIDQIPDPVDLDRWTLDHLRSQLASGEEVDDSDLRTRVRRLEQKLVRRSLTERMFAQAIEAHLRGDDL